MITVYHHSGLRKEEGKGGGAYFLPKFICRFELCNVDIIFEYVKITVMQMKEKWAEET